MFVCLFVCLITHYNTCLLPDALGSESKEPFLQDPWNHKYLAGRALFVSRSNTYKADTGLGVFIAFLCGEKVLEKRGYKENKSTLASGFRSWPALLDLLVLWWDRASWLQEAMMELSRSPCVVRMQRV